MSTVVQIQSQVAVQFAVTDDEVNRILNLRDNRAMLKRRLEEVEATLEQAEEGVIKMLETGNPVKSSYPLRVKTSERHFPSWKDAFISHLGQSAAAKVLAQTQPRIYKTLIITK